MNTIFFNKKNSHEKDAFYWLKMRSNFLCLFLGSMLFLSHTFIADAQCNYFEGDIALQISIDNTDATTESTEYYLTDLSATILQISSTPNFSAVSAGNYKTFAVAYKNDSGISGNQIGNTVYDITGACFDLSDGQLIKVCVSGCEYFVGDVVNLQITDAGSVAADITTVYLLTDSSGEIVETGNTPSFTINMMGNYSIYGLSYNSNDNIVGISTGDLVADISGGCFTLGIPYCFTVCPSECTWYADTYIFYSKGGMNLENASTDYVLTNETGEIVAISNTAKFSNLAEGTYLIYPVSYNSVSGISNLSVGNSINTVNAICFDIGLPLSFRYCPCGPDCDVSPNASFTFESVGGTTENSIVEFLLVDMDGNIIDKSATTEFANIALGQYQIIAINYENTNLPSGLNVGDNLINIAGGCLDFSEPVCLNVCDTCAPVKCMQVIITKVNN